MPIQARLHVDGHRPRTGAVEPRRPGRPTIRGRPRVAQPVAARLAPVPRHRLALIGSVIFLFMVLRGDLRADHLALRPARHPRRSRSRAATRRRSSRQAHLRHRQRRPERVRPDRQRRAAVDADRPRHDAHRGFDRRHRRRHWPASSAAGSTASSCASSTSSSPSRSCSSSSSRPGSSAGGDPSAHPHLRAACRGRSSPGSCGRCSCRCANRTSSTPPGRSG